MNIARLHPSTSMQILLFYKYERVSVDLDLHIQWLPTTVGPQVPDSSVTTVSQLHERGR